MRVVHLMLALSMVLVGCTDSPDEANLSDAEHGVVVRNRIASNRIASNRIASNRIASNRIASNRIASNRLAANEAALGDLLTTDEGIELFGFIISCALPQGTQLVARDGTTPDPDDTITFQGEVGLAPRWVDRPMNHRDERWVSACMFSRVNNNDVTVEISIRGPSFTLASSSDERNTWTLQEGAFYGNMFVDPDAPLPWYACRGRSQAAGETGGLNDRDCAEPDPANPGKTMCGFNYAGDCADFVAPDNKYACVHEAFGEKGFYLGCRTSARFGDDDDDDDHDGHHGHGHHGGWHGHHHGGGGHGHHRSGGHGHDDDDDDDQEDGDNDHDDDFGWRGGHTFHQVITTYTLP
jgi:hypothetical protein